MSNKLEYIDKYFIGELSPAEKADFEKSCESDTVFAESVAFYIAARAALKAELADEKVRDFKEMYQRLSKEKSRGAILKRLAPYLKVAAACIVLLMMWQFFFRDLLLGSGRSAQFAQEYIEKNLQTLGVAMGSPDKDSLELGISAFNKRNYPEAKKIFQALSVKTGKNAEPIRDLGILYLVTGDYDQAIATFDTLAKLPDLHINPGLFYKALCLMKRSGPGDRERARAILQEVIDRKLAGDREAAEWINKM